MNVSAVLWDAAVLCREHSAALPALEPPAVATAPTGGPRHQKGVMGSDRFGNNPRTVLSTVQKAERFFEFFFLHNGFLTF